MQDGSPIGPTDCASGRSSRGIVPSRILYGCFAFVMATGIVSIATHLTGLTPISNILLGLNLIVFVVLWGLLLLGLLREPGFVLADARSHDRAPKMLTIVAATCVIGNEVALAGGGAMIVTALWAIAAVLWCGLTYLLLAGITSQAEKPPLEGSIDGSWLLVVVATEALAILTIRVVSALALPGSALFAGLCLFLLGGALYGILLSLIVHRWLFLPMRPDQLTPAYWINMGAAAIATLAGTQILAATDGVTVLAPVRAAVFTATILFWSLASWWIPLLAVLTVWRRRRSFGFMGSGLDEWSMVFPLGMYATASWRLSHDLGLTFLRVVPLVFVWVALAAWCLTLFDSARPLFRSSRTIKR